MLVKEIWIVMGSMMRKIIAQTFLIQISLIAIKMGAVITVIMTLMVMDMMSLMRLDNRLTIVL